MGAKKYIGSFSNTQVDYSDNSPNEQDIFAVITDVSNPYNLAYTYEVDGGNVTYTFTFDPGDLTGVVISYAAVGGNGPWTFVGPYAPTSPIELTLSTPPLHQFIVYLQNPSSGSVVDFSENETSYEEIEIELSAIPVSKRITDQDDDKYTPIRSSAYEIQVHTDENIDIFTFKDGNDNSYKVEICVGDTDTVVWTGWLSISDLRQRFQPNPNVLVLTATDGLGFLREFPLTDTNGDQFSGPNKLISYIAGCLIKTGLELFIVAEMNIREKDSWTNSTGHFFNDMYLEALTFESEVGEFEDSYTVLEKILGEMCVLFQQKNIWYIKRVDEYGGFNNTQAQFAYDGTFDSNLTATTYPKNIGADNSTYGMAFMNEDAEVFLIRPYKRVRHTFNYNYPQELPCNSDFSRGDLLEDSDPDNVTYEVECWTLKEGMPGWPGTVDGTTAAIHREYDDFNVEIARYVVLTPRTTFESSSVDDATYIESQSIYIEEKDKFTASVDWKLESTIATGGNGNARLFRCALNGDDGSWWILGETSTGSGVFQWWDMTVVAGQVTANTAKGDVSIDFDAIDETEWQNITWEAPPAPVSGKLYLWLNQFNQLASATDDLDIWYSNLRFDFIPFINGSYQRFTGQYDESEQTNGKAAREKEVFITDAPRRMMKGCLLKYDGSEYVRTEGFFDYLIFPSGYDSEDDLKPFGQMQNQDVWNQFNRTTVGYEGTIDGLETETQDGLSRPDLPGLLHSFYLKDSSRGTNNKTFQLLHFEQDLYLCEWDLFLVESYDSTIEKSYEGHTFEYIRDDR